MSTINAPDPFSTRRAALEKMYPRDREQAFRTATGLAPSSAWRPLFGNRRERDCCIPGSDDIRVWRLPHKRGWILTDERWPTGFDNGTAATEEFCSRHGWRMLHSAWPGFWSPPRTNLILLSPPKVGIDPAAIERMLLEAMRREP